SVIDQLCLLSSTSLAHRSSEEVLEPAGDLRGYHPPYRLRNMSVEQPAGGVADFSHQCGSQENSVVGDRAVGCCQLHRRDPELVAHGQAGASVHRLPPVRTGEASTRLGGKLRPCRGTEPEVTQRLILLLRLQPRRKLGH